VREISPLIFLCFFLPVRFFSFAPCFPAFRFGTGLKAGFVEIVLCVGRFPRRRPSRGRFAGSCLRRLDVDGEGFFGVRLRGNNWKQFFFDSPPACVGFFFYPWAIGLRFLSDPRATSQKLRVLVSHSRDPVPAALHCCSAFCLRTPILA